MVNLDCIQNEDLTSQLATVCEERWQELEILAANQMLKYLR